MSQPPLRRRLIEDRDLDAVAALLAQGFPERPAAWWRRGFERMRRRDSPDGFPRYGRVLTSGDTVVGALVTIHAAMPGTGPLDLRCNLSSWHVRREFAGYASLLLGAALRDRTVSYTNISPAPHTPAIIEAQGFRAFTEGSLATVPLLSRSEGHVRVRLLEAADADGSRALTIAADHAALGCLCLLAETPEGPQPFVFSRMFRIGRFVPARHLLYCRDIEAYARHAAAVGRALLRNGTISVLVDGVRELPGVPGRLINQGQKKYVAGPNPPRPGDLAYTELAIFG